MSMSVKPALSELFMTCIGICATSDNPTGVIVVSPTVSGVRLVLDLDDCSCVSWEGSCSDTWSDSEDVVASCVRTAPSVSCVGHGSPLVQFELDVGCA